MPAIVRVGDTVTGVCNGPGHPSNHPYTAVWVNGDTDKFCDGKGVIRVGDTGNTDCGHHIRAIVGSPISSAQAKPIVRVGDPVEVIEGGTGTCITGSPVSSTV